MNKVIGVHCVLYRSVKSRDGDQSVEVLLQKRNRKARIYPGYWALFGGTLEENEGEVDCLVREVKEESGFKMNPKFIVPITKLTIHRIGMKFQLAYYGYEINEDCIVLSDESIGYAYFNATEINTSMIRPEDKVAIDTFYSIYGF